MLQITWLKILFIFTFYTLSIWKAGAIWVGSLFFRLRSSNLFVKLLNNNDKTVDNTYNTCIFACNMLVYVAYVLSKFLLISATMVETRSRDEIKSDYFSTHMSRRLCVIDQRMYISKNQPFGIGYT